MAISALRICDLATAAAYVVLDNPTPEPSLRALVSRYHATDPLIGAEIDMLWPLLQMRLAVSVVNATLMAREIPSDPYITISRTPAWWFLEAPVDALLPFRLRTTCGLPLEDAVTRVAQWLDTARGGFAEVIGETFTENRTGRLDYGGMVILRHETHQGDIFQTLYGHLDPDSITHLQDTQRSERGEVTATLGAGDCSGDWCPHFTLSTGTDAGRHAHRLARFGRSG